MLHVNLVRWRNLIGSLSGDIWQYPMIEISNSEIMFSSHDGRLVTLIKSNKNKSMPMFICGVFPCSIHTVVCTIFGE